MLLLSRHSTNLAVLLSLIGLMVTVYSKPLCPNDCKLAKTYHPPSIKHVSDLQNSSIAPWTMGCNEKEGRQPFAINHVVCKACIKKGMDSKTIYIQISVYERITSDITTWCECPFKLAVGCTCVMSKRHQGQA